MKIIYLLIILILCICLKEKDIIEYYICKQPIFQPKKWNKKINNIQEYNNCYAYALRDYELNRDANRQFAMMQRTLPLVDLYAETAAKRRLMEDQFSPTKISQQRLRAQQGEAALMNAISNQTTAAVNMARSGINPRGRAGGA